MQGRWHIILNVNVIIKSNYFTILLPSLDIVFAIIVVINHMVSINSLTTWGQIIPAGGTDNFQVWRCRAESHHPREWQGFGSLSPLTDEQERKVLDALHSWVGSEDMKAPNLCFGWKKQICLLPLQCHKIHPCRLSLFRGSEAVLLADLGQTHGQLPVAQSGTLLLGRLPCFNRSMKWV